ncbi:cobalamin synthesis protein P47K [Thermocrinis albus DSM 14484]|uniref:Cobalamin synthesis protein P47K n=1 Tax=Thermocrinis albus (strain DSM 14484 / JCM 11386 / HI 11/12) TaxID=638303 RepID=D3SQ54_THEAH|nr:GTP-binding protein [Thermocrinis albus]ADC89291.1 cobalamin synthesis protein P47K [Thermocrinis albus DSM 14484]
MLPAFVVTGFLGSGKTTLLVRAAREHFGGKRVAVLVNEIGEVGVDGKVLQNVYSSVVELAEGCICCSLHAEFEKGIKEIREKYDPEVLLVETSGAAEPFPVMLSLQSLGCSIEGVICVVDAKNFEKYKNESTARYQIGGSNIVVINKVDLVDAQRCDELEKEIKKIWEEYSIRNVFTGERIFSYLRVYRTSFGQLPAEVFEGIFVLDDLSKYTQPSPAHQHQHRVAEQVIQFPQPLEYDKLVDLLKNLPADVIRVKGIVRIANMKNPVIVNYAFGLWDIGEEIPSYRGSSFLVFIKRGGVQA